MTHAARLATCSFLALTVFTGAAQTVYKCESKGAITYSHEPCIGAQVVDTTPTQGLDKSSGSSRKGADVRQIEQSKAMADALRPIFGETPAQREKRHRRFKLPPGDRMECDDLDSRLLRQRQPLAAPPKLRPRKLKLTCSTAENATASCGAKGVTWPQGKPPNSLS
jgi:hypothetical protein